MQNIGRICSLQLDSLFEARAPSHPLSFTLLTDHLTVKLTRNLMDDLAKEIPLLFNSKWRELVHIINIPTFAASMADAAENQEARSQVDKMPVTIDKSQSDQQAVQASDDKITSQLLKVLLEPLQRSGGQLACVPRAATPCHRGCGSVPIMDWQCRSRAATNLPN
ncbi:hypothetical protein PGT21_008180 [Puccinia graminis f. sp. tritici]|uniref:Uncharacterized protein n=1 Tax=Puccinia graminis f. sp. tritici TaxID=56615 RepID=A0A5B0NFT6_PUCGR|nr:hypothetical protein PGT21_008180 [Puccinia graminis f. sp. tritici]